jgi:hypothetical protein
MIIKLHKVLNARRKDVFYVRFYDLTLSFLRPSRTTLLLLPLISHRDLPFMWTMMKTGQSSRARGDRLRPLKISGASSRTSSSPLRTNSSLKRMGSKLLHYRIGPCKYLINRVSYKTGA